jgi:hypothetical protein
MAIIPNIGTYPAAVTFCKMLDISNMITDNFHNKEIIDDLLMIEAQFVGNDAWNLVYHNTSYNFGTVLPHRKFITKTWLKDKFQVCNSLKLGNETLLLHQLQFKFRWLDCREKMIYRPPNLQVFLHGWGSFETVKYEINLAQVPQVYQLDQETVITVPTKAKECSFYESGSLDECLESNAELYAYSKVSCDAKPQR